MKILNYGSLNIDYTYRVQHFAKPGETIKCDNMKTFYGGKGLNQTIALAKSGIHVFHAGKIGINRRDVLDFLKENNVDTNFIIETTGTTGHAIIQIDKDGENEILTFGGTNLSITNDDIDKTLSDFKKGDVIILQNEISNIPYIMETAKKRGAYIAFNPAPMVESVLSYPLNLVDCLFVNRVEGQQITNCSFPEDIISKLSNQYPNMTIVLTLGNKGVCCYYEGKIYRHGIVDTTAAGDTFIGYFLSFFLQNPDIKSALKYASIASSISVSRYGAAQSIPMREEVLKSDLQLEQC